MLGMVLDPAFGRDMEAMFHDDLRFAEEIDLAAFRRRPRLSRVAEWAANLITRVL
jgi:cardiolipin synthase